MLGGSGDDQLIAGLGDDVLDGGTGTDLASLYNVVSGITVNLTTGTVSGGNSDGDTLISIEGVSATNFDNSLTGNSAANTFAAGNGNDTLIGLDGDDMLIGSAGIDSIDGGLANDTVGYQSSVFAVNLNLTTLVATSGDAVGDTLISIENVTGSTFGDTLTGSAGANVLDGFNGDDILTGGAGADVYLFADTTEGVAGGWGSDMIKGFQNGLDHISFVGAGGVHSFADLTISMIGADAFITTGAETIQLLNFGAASLDPTDFIFGA